MWTAKEIKQPYMIAYGASANSGDAVIRQFAEAGVNIIQMNDWGDVSDAVRTSLSQIAQKYHVGILPWAFANRGLIPHWSKDPSIFGWYMWDEPGRDEDYPLSLRQQVYRETKDASGGLPMVSIWDDPVWGTNIGPGLCDIVGYEVAYPFEIPDISDPFAWTTARCKIYGYGTGPLDRARQAGMLVIPVLQSWVKQVVVPDILGQYQAYLNCFPFDPSAYLYDPVKPVNHIIKVPELKALVQQLTIQLGGTIRPIRPEDIACPQCESVLKVHYK